MTDCVRLFVYLCALRVGGSFHDHVRSKNVFHDHVQQQKRIIVYDHGDSISCFMYDDWQIKRYCSNLSVLSFIIGPNNGQDTVLFVAEV